MIIYKGDWRIEKNPKPIPDRTHDWDFWRDGYVDLDAPWQGTASSVDDAIRQIDEMMDEEDGAEGFEGYELDFWAAMEGES